jgi:hypothetical protein
MYILNNKFMSLTVVNKKIADEVKIGSKRKALGLSCSSYLLSSIKESKSERKSGNFYSFQNNQEAINFLDNI